MRFICLFANIYIYICGQRLLRAKFGNRAQIDFCREYFLALLTLRKFGLTAEEVSKDEGCKFLLVIICPKLGHSIVKW